MVFPTSQRLTPEAYEALWDEIAAKLEDAGYSVEKQNQPTSEDSRPSGLDRSKRTAVSLFYAPCQAKNPADSFFYYYSEAPRQLVDPMLWIENNVVQFPVRTFPKRSPGAGAGRSISKR